MRFEQMFEGYVPSPYVQRRFKKRVMVLVQARLAVPTSGISTFIESIIAVLPEDTLIEVKLVGTREPERFGLYENSNVVIEFHEMNKVRPVLNLMGVKSLDYDLINAYRRVLHANCFDVKTYDCILTNDPEGALAASSMGQYASVFNTVYVTHHSTFNGARDVPNDDNEILFCNEVIPKLNNVRVITQLPGNAEYMARVHGVQQNVEVIPLILPVYPTPGGERKGCLFIGKFEKRKGAYRYIEMCAMAGVKPVVITGGKGARDKWTEGFEKHGITDYELHIGVHGEEKLKVINSALFGFVASSNESYGYNCLETLCSCPLIILNSPHGLHWRQYEGAYCVSTLKEAANIAKSLNEIVYTGYRVAPNLCDDLSLAADRWIEVLIGQREEVTSSDIKVFDYLLATEKSQQTIVDEYEVQYLLPHEYLALLTNCQYEHTYNETFWRVK